MQNNKQYDILACLKDIEQSIIEIYDFLPIERNFFVLQKDFCFFRFPRGNHCFATVNECLFVK